MVKLLLETGKMDEESGDDVLGFTPLFWAAVEGHEAVAKILLETGTVGVDRKDTEGRTPLSWAAVHGHKGVVKLLL